MQSRFEHTMSKALAAIRKIATSFGQITRQLIDASFFAWHLRDKLTRISQDSWNIIFQRYRFLKRLLYCCFVRIGLLN